MLLQLNMGTYAFSMKLLRHWQSLLALKDAPLQAHKSLPVPPQRGSSLDNPSGAPALAEVQAVFCSTEGPTEARRNCSSRNPSIKMEGGLWPKLKSLPATK